MRLRLETAPEEAKASSGASTIPSYLMSHMLAVLSLVFGARCAIHCHGLVDVLGGDPRLAVAVTTWILCQARSAGSAAEGKASGQGLHVSLPTHTPGSGTVVVVLLVLPLPLPMPPVPLQRLLLLLLLLPLPLPMPPVPLQRLLLLLLLLLLNPLHCLRRQRRRRGWRRRPPQ